MASAGKLATIGEELAAGEDGGHDGDGETKGCDRAADVVINYLSELADGSPLQLTRIPVHGRDMFACVLRGVSDTVRLRVQFHLMASAPAVALQAKLHRQLAVRGVTTLPPRYHSGLEEAVVDLIKSENKATAEVPEVHFILCLKGSVGFWTHDSLRPAVPMLLQRAHCRTFLVMDLKGTPPLQTHEDAERSSGVVVCAPADPLLMDALPVRPMAPIARNITFHGVSQLVAETVGREVHPVNTGKQEICSVAQGAEAEVTEVTGKHVLGNDWGLLLYFHNAPASVSSRGKAFSLDLDTRPCAGDAEASAPHFRVPALHALSAQLLMVMQRCHMHDDTMHLLNAVRHSGASKHARKQVCDFVRQHVYKGDASAEDTEMRKYAGKLAVHCTAGSTDECARTWISTLQSTLRSLLPFDFEQDDGRPAPPLYQLQRNVGRPHEATRMVSGSCVNPGVYGLYG